MFRFLGVIREALIVGSAYGLYLELRSAWTQFRYFARPISGSRCFTASSLASITTYLKLPTIVSQIAKILWPRI